MKTKNADLPAMPQDRGIWVDGIGDCPSLATGLSKREYFAGMAMQGLLSGGYCIDDARNRLIDVPSEAANLADALLAELEKDQ